MATKKPGAAAADTTPHTDAQASNGSQTEGTATEAVAEGTKAPRAAAANFLPIVRGRLPLIFVHAVRYDPVVMAMAKKDTATKLATSVGKVFDIQKGRNFGYVSSDFKPTADDMAAAQAWINQTGAANVKGQTAVGDKDLMTKILEQYKTRGLASAEETAAFSAARTSTRAKPVASTGGTVAVKSEAAQTASADTGAALLS